ncbi:hypothetical protein [Streptomyces sp. JW3]|uniref:hypothetical protein n=1 Tax=Streptomyces sp. JW3 TaxID=3456955 RepID=UPI003FA46202
MAGGEGGDADGVLVRRASGSREVGKSGSAGLADPGGGARGEEDDICPAAHWDDVVLELGYAHLRRHGLRHTGLTWLAGAGVSVHVLRRIAGRGSLVTTQGCRHPDVHKITAAGAALSAHLTAVRAPRPLPSPIVMTR